MAGALMQLVAYGAQDVYLTADPTITFWKAVYKRHTNFAMESMVQSLTGTPNFGNKAVCKISRNGDLIGRTYVQVTLPDISSYNSYYVNRVGFCLLKSVELRIGGQQIDYHYSTWMHIWTELTHDVDMKSLLDKLVGLKENDGVNASQANPGTLYIPLLFSYCRNPGLSLPLIALQYHEVELWITFETLNNCLNDGNIYKTVPSTLTLSNVNVWIDYIFLDTEERKEFAQKPHEYLIEITQSQDNSISSTGRSTTRLTFNHPTKFISWVLRDPEAGCSPFTQVIAWGYGGIGLKSDGSLWTWGANWDGELGNGNDTDSNTPNQVGTETDWISVAGGSYNTFAIKSNGTLWATGYNDEGELGIGGFDSKNVFTQVGTDSDWKKVNASGYHTFGIKTDGTLWSWGYNINGQLGLGPAAVGNNYDTPQQVGTDNDWQDVITNFDDYSDGFTLAIKNDNTLYATGYNFYGQLGLGNTTDRDTFEQVGSAKWNSISAGQYFTTGIQEDGSLWSWGYNGYGQLGQGDYDNTSSPTRIGSATNWTIINNGGDHSAAINSLGYLYMWGGNYDGQLGNGDVNGDDVLVPTQIGTDNDWINVQTGLYHTFAIKDTLELYAVGFNSDGELGLGYDHYNNKPTSFKPDGTTFDIVQSSKYLSDGGTPISSYIFTMAIKNDGTLWGWGQNGKGQLGLGTTNTYITPQHIGSSTWLAIATGSAHSAGISNGELYATGDNSKGQLGQGNTTNLNVFTKIGSATNWTKVSCGCANTAAVNSLGELWICGYNVDGQCAQGTGFGGANETSLVQENTLSTDWVDVVCGGYHIIGIKNDGTIYAWGYNNFGQIGDATNTRKDTPIQIGTSSWTKITAGIHYTLGIKDDNTLYAWGHNNTGQLGNGNNTDQWSPLLISSDSWKTISSSNYTSFGIKSDNTLWGWGRNSEGQIGIENNTTNSNILLKVNNYTVWTNVFAGAYFSFGLINNNTNINLFATNISLFAWGSYSYMGFYNFELFSFTLQPCNSTDTFTSFSSYNTLTSTLASAKIRLNGQDRFQERNGTYFNYIQPYQHFEIKPDIGINVYSFALKPAEHQPSGSCNLSRIDNVNLDITPTINPEGDGTPLQLSVYAFSYNVLRIASGMGGLAFSN